MKRDPNKCFVTHLKYVFLEGQFNRVVLDNLLFNHYIISKIKDGIKYCLHYL